MGFRCDGKQSLYIPSRTRLEILGKGEEWLHDRKRGAERSKIAAKIMRD
jgi:hypothetical protein